MIKKQFDNDNFALYAPDSLNYITKNIENDLSNSLNLYKRIFNIDNYRKVQINYFDNLEEFRNFIYELRGEKESLPKYAVGTFDEGMINAYIEPNIIEGTPKYYKRKFMAPHELFHIMYNELISTKNNMQRIVWFDEGMAQLFSGEFQNELEDYDNFARNIISNTKVIPNLNELKHGRSFETEDYSGYKLSLIAVKYIYDKIGIEAFRELLFDKEKILDFGENVLKEIANNYNNSRKVK